LPVSGNAFGWLEIRQDEFGPCMRFKYRKLVLDDLARHGIIPAEDTPPDLIRDYLNGLYLFEIRSLRARMKAGEIKKEDYAGHVSELRNRYPLLGLPMTLWIEES